MKLKEEHFNFIMVVIAIMLILILVFGVRATAQRIKYATGKAEATWNDTTRKWVWGIKNSHQEQITYHGDYTLIGTDTVGYWSYKKRNKVEDSSSRVDEWYAMDNMKRPCTLQMVVDKYTHQTLLTIYYADRAIAYYVEDKRRVVR